ncbi:MAG: hypothetical protein DSY33_03735 [Archaeoglobus sp.]|jgi:uncharacterized membrane protein|nr:MAG: hypothetical protein DSY33_03735 [Archaeoglobus sp.]
MKGVTLAIVSALLWGIAPLFDKLAIVNSKVLPIPANTVRCLGAVAALLTLAVITGEWSFSAIDMKRAIYLVLAGAIAGGFAMVTYYAALKELGAGKTVPLTSIYPLFTVIFSVLILGERVNVTRAILGTLLIVCGVVLVMFS